MFRLETYILIAQSCRPIRACMHMHMRTAHRNSRTYAYEYICMLTYTLEHVFVHTNTRACKCNDNCINSMCLSYYTYTREHTDFEMNFIIYIRHTFCRCEFKRWNT